GWVRVSTRPLRGPPTRRPCSADRRARGSAAPQRPRPEVGPTPPPIRPLAGCRAATASAMLVTMSTTRRGYGRYWLGLLPELGFLLPLLPVTIVGLSVLLTLFWTGVGMIPIVIGVFLVLAALFVARGFGIFELGRLRGALFPAITPPRWDRTMRQGSALSTLLPPLVDGHYWLYLLHGSLVNPIVGIVSWSITISWLAVALSGVAYPFVAVWIPESDGLETVLDLLETRGV